MLINIASTTLWMACIYNIAVMIKLFSIVFSNFQIFVIASLYMPVAIKVETNQHGTIFCSSISNTLSSIQLNPNEVLNITLINHQIVTEKNHQIGCFSNHIK